MHGLLILIYLVPIYFTLFKILIYLVPIYFTLLKILIYFVSIYFTLFKILIYFVSIYFTLLKILIYFVSIYFTLFKIFIYFVPIYRSLLPSSELSLLKEVLEGDGSLMEHSYSRDDGQGRRSRMCLWWHPGNDVTGIIHWSNLAWCSY